MSGDETILARRQRLSQVPRACEGCRVRKIRCDRNNPCANCQASNITCRQFNLKPPDQRPKVDKVIQLEEYVTTLEARLARVELRLGDADPVTAPLNEPLSSLSQAISAATELHDVGPSGVGALYQGSSSFLNQSVQAREVAQQAATSGTPGAAQTLNESFSHLDSLLHHGAESQDREQTSLPDAPARLGLTILPLPISAVIAILRRIKSQPSMFLAGHAIIDVPLIEHLCQKVYFPTEPASIGQIASVQGLLHLILREYEITQQPLGKEWNTKQLRIQAGRNFDLAIESFHLLTVPSFENVLALTLAVLKAESEAKPVLCRALLASACSHCQMLGYHREITHQKDTSGTAEAKRRLFWMLYSHDKDAALILGHASRVQDFEIDACFPTLSSDPTQRPWDELFCLLIRISRMQGQIYDKLYSVAALQSEPVERKRCIDALSADMYKWRNDFDQWTGSGVSFTYIVELSRIHCDIRYYSTLTSLLRALAIPGVGADMSSQCFQAARLTLQCHIRCFSLYGRENLVSKSEFVNWALHNSSFTPFVVIFLHAVAANSREDVQMLDEVVKTLDSARNSPASTEKLYQICAAFARLARRMVEARNTGMGTYDQRTDSLHLGPVSEDVPFNWPEPLTQSPGQHMDPEDFSGILDDDMSSILVDWINGQPPETAMFGMDFHD